MGPPGEEDVAPPLRPLEPRRETLVVTLSEPQWESFRSCLSANIRRRFEKAGEFLTQIGTSCGWVACAWPLECGVTMLGIHVVSGEVEQPHLRHVATVTRP